MCKILIASGITLDMSQGSGKQFLEAATKALTEYDKDGFGYAAIDSKGSMWGERWVDVKAAWQPEPKTSSTLTPFKPFLEGFTSADTYSRFGVNNFTDARTVLLHARQSTNTISIANTHPFVADGVALIHNGVIHQPPKELMIQSTCDSEVILNLYNYLEVLKEPKNMSFVSNELSGWYAVGALSETGILDVFKDQASNLVMAHVPELGTNAVVFVTKADILAKACTAAGYAVPNCYSVKAGVLMRLNAFTGQLITSAEFDVDKYYTDYDYKDEYKGAAVEPYKHSASGWSYDSESEVADETDEYKAWETKHLRRVK